MRLRKEGEKSQSGLVKNEQDIRGNFYKLSAETVSLAEGLMGKDHALTQKLRGLRSELIGHQNPMAPPRPPPAQPPPPAEVTTRRIRTFGVGPGS